MRFEERVLCFQPLDDEHPLERMKCLYLPHELFRCCSDLPSRDLG